MCDICHSLYSGVTPQTQSKLTMSTAICVPKRPSYLSPFNLIPLSPYLHLSSLSPSISPPSLTRCHLPLFLSFKVIRLTYPSTNSPLTVTSVIFLATYRIYSLQLHCLFATLLFPFSLNSEYSVDCRSVKIITW